MSDILDFINSLNHPYKYDSCKKLLDDWNGAEIYEVSASASKGLILGWPTMIRKINGKFEEVMDCKEKLKIMSAARKLKPA